MTCVTITVDHHSTHGEWNVHDHLTSQSDEDLEIPYTLKISPLIYLVTTLHSLCEIASL